MSTDDSKRWYLLFIGIMIPYLGRSFEGFVTNYFWGLVAKFFDDRNIMTEAIIPTKSRVRDDQGKAVWIELEDDDTQDIIDLKNKANVEFSGGEIPSDSHIACLKDVANPEITTRWIEVRVCMGWSNRVALAVALFRLVFWHWLQPVMYLWALYSYCNVIDRLQLYFGLGVAVREIMYAIITFAALYRNPSFLICNVANIYGRGRNFLFEFICYIASPEKFVALCCVNSELGLCSRTFMWLGISVIPLLDLCGLCALIIGAKNGDLPPALAVSYCVAAIALIPVLPFLLVMVVSCVQMLHKVVFNSDRTKSDGL